MLVHYLVKVEKLKMHVNAISHHRHAHMILDGHASIGDVPIKVKTSLHQAFLQIVDVINLCFMHALLNNTRISKCQAHDDPGLL